MRLIKKFFEKRAEKARKINIACWDIIIRLESALSTEKELFSKKYSFIEPIDLEKWKKEDAFPAIEDSNTTIPTLKKANAYKKALQLKCEVILKKKHYWCTER